MSETAPYPIFLLPDLSPQQNLLWSSSSRQKQSLSFYFSMLSHDIPLQICGKKLFPSIFTPSVISLR
jgi:hypothetical protein